jgi:nitrite reductase/ring-hydroxylating ferredoxin subunit
MTHYIDLARVICALADLAEGACRGFSIGAGAWPLSGVVVRVNSEVRAYVNCCPHAGHPLNLQPHRFLTPDGALLLCHSHGALFDKDTGYCIAGPCAGRSLQQLPLQIESGLVLLSDDYALP